MNFRILLSATLFIASNIFSSISYAESSVWKISKGEKYFYLGGTMHLLSPQDYPLPKEYTNAYRDSDKLIFETDIANSKTPDSQQKFLSVMTYSSDKTLIDDLNDETYLQLKDFLASRNIPIENFTMFHPWATALTISIIEYQRFGMTPEYGIEEYFRKSSLSDNKELGSLESLDEQIDFIKSMEKIDPNVMVNYTLRDLEALPDFIKVLRKSWRHGDIESFTTNSSIVKMKAEFPELYNTFVTNRNNKWMSGLIILNDNNIKEFVLVGTMHLNGKEGLLNQLHLAGFDIDQL